MVELVSSSVLLTRKQLVCCGWYVGLGVGLCLELLLRWCALSEDVELHQVSETKRELILGGKSVAGSIIDIMRFLQLRIIGRT